MYKLKLQSGNIFWYKPGDNSNIGVACISDQENKFIGGFAGKEAARKFEAFKPFSEVENAEFPNVSEMDVSDYAQKLGALSKDFTKHLALEFNDRQHMDGTDSIAQSCDERENYFNVVGLDMIKNSKNIPLWAFVANHLSVFGAQKFRETWFKGDDTVSKDTVVGTAKTKHGEKSYKAPAPYIRALCQYFS